MKVVEVKTKKEKKKFLEFRTQIYKENPMFIDNDLFVLKELFFGKSSFTENKEIIPLYIEDKRGNIVCEAIAIYTKELSEYISLSYFQSKKGQEKAVKELISKVNDLGKKFNCKKIVIGLCGHVNYGLGLLDSHFNTKNSFSSSSNPDYYNDYFRNLKCSEIKLNTYKLHNIDNRLDRYKSIIRKLESNYEFRFFNKKEFDYYSKIYTDLNNECFVKHRYYYKRTYKEDKEMLKELFMFMKEDSLIFAFKDNIPVGFIMWYPDFNYLAKNGEAFGPIHYIRNIFNNKKIKTAKVMEYGIKEEYRKVGLPIALLNEIFKTLKKNYKNITSAETSWILEENKDSNSVCKTICDELYKRYVVYEKKVK